MVLAVTAIALLAESDTGKESSICLSANQHLPGMFDGGNPPLDPPRSPDVGQPRSVCVSLFHILQKGTAAIDYTSGARTK